MRNVLLNLLLACCLGVPLLAQISVPPLPAPRTPPPPPRPPSWPAPRPAGVGPLDANSPPSAVSVTPSSGTGLTQTFSFLFSDPNGFTDIAATDMLINGPFGSANSCYTTYSRSLNQLWLLNDAATSWGASIMLGSASTLQNSQCMVGRDGFFRLGVGQ